jgi:galactose mutarotase-like enzyme
MSSAKYIKAQLAFQELTGLKKGSKVRIIAQAVNRQYGWSANWHPDMTAAVNDGKEYEVTYMADAHGVQVNDWNYPFFCLEVVDALPNEIKLDSGDYTALINNDGSIKVGCQNISYATLKQIFEAATKHIV